ncbi:MAG: NERD domain-containing protein [Acholeplasmatales bacterium]|nr:MAG: NERD domain-containing protein [Acholeplasmatales bacterium]
MEVNDMHIALTALVHLIMESTSGINFLKVWLTIALLGGGAYGLYKVVKVIKRPASRQSASSKARRWHGEQFEQHVVKALQEHDPSATTIVNGLFKRAGAINTYFEIDIILISSKGIFVLELKNWQGYLYGDLKQEHWVIGSLQNNRLLYAKQVYSPVKQNTKHIEDLQALYPFNYVGHVIFSTRTQIGDGTIGVSDFDGFLAQIAGLEDVLDQEDIRHHAQRLSALVQHGREGEHIARIETNRRRYGG